MMSILYKKKRKTEFSLSTDVELRFIFCYFSPTFVLDRPTSVLDSPPFVEIDDKFDSSWDSCRIRLSASFQYRNKIYGKIQIEPTHSINLIDHFKLYINDIEQEIVISSKDFHYPLDGLTYGEQYQMHVIAYPKDHISHARPISSNRIVRTGTQKEHFWSVVSFSPFIVYSIQTFTRIRLIVKNLFRIV
jgi:hypothetical protein